MVDVKADATDTSALAETVALDQADPDTYNCACFWKLR